MAETVTSRPGDSTPLRSFEGVVLVGEFGPPALAFARGCRRLGVSLFLLEITDAPPAAQRYSSALSGMKRISPRLIGTEEGIEAILRHVRSVSADGVIAIAEHVLMWLSHNRKAFSPDCRLLCPGFECLEAISFKNRQIKLARVSGFSLLPTWYLKDAADVARIPQDHFPICVRPSHPAEARPTFKAVVHHSRETLERQIGALTFVGAPIVAQPFKVLPDVKIHGMRSADGTRMMFVPFYVERKYQGVTLTLQRTSFPPGVEAACAEFAVRANITGAFHFDLLFDPEQNRAYYLEINPRMGGVTDKAVAFGYDQPKLILEAFGHPQTADLLGSGTSRIRVVTKRAVCRHILAALKGELTPLDYPDCSCARHVLLSLRDLVFARDSVFDRHDLRGTIWFNTQSFNV